jgi:hypothetical protein
MRRYVDEVRATGATPVLITPLARRSFRKGKVTNDLAPWADATRNVAREAGVPVLDLNTESLAAVQKMGPLEANMWRWLPRRVRLPDTAASGDAAFAPKKRSRSPAPGGKSSCVPLHAPWR